MGIRDWTLEKIRGLSLNQMMALTEDEFDEYKRLTNNGETAYPHTWILWFAPWGPPDAMKPYASRHKISVYQEWLGSEGFSDSLAMRLFLKELEEARVHWPDCEDMWLIEVSFNRSKTPGGSSPPPSSSQVASIIKFFDMRAKDGNGDERYRLYPLAA